MIHHNIISEPVAKSSFTTPNFACLERRYFLSALVIAVEDIAERYEDALRTYDFIKKIF